MTGEFARNAWRNARAALLARVEERIARNRTWAGKHGPESPVVRNEIDPTTRLLVDVRNFIEETQP